jgi:hypothetical protein
MWRTLIGLFLFIPLLPAQPPKADAPEPAPVVRLAPQATRPPARPLEYRLMPDPGDLVHGNAAPMWLRAGHLAQNVKRKITDKEYRWEGGPLKDLPRKDVREFLADYAAAFRIADQAALRSRCDWELPPLTVQTIGDLPLDDIQLFRHLAFLLGIRFRSQLAEGHFDEAAATLRTGLALARDVGQADTVVQSLVGLAIAQVMLNRAEEWVQTPGSPNLYWPLTDLPRTLFDLRRPTAYELNTIYRSFPQLRKLRKKDLTAEQAQALAEEVFGALFSWEKEKGGDVPAWAPKAALALIAAKAYPEAKQALIEQGRPAREVEAMPVLQVVAVRYLDQYDRLGDDFLKWLSLPPWQALPGLQQTEREARALAQKGGNPLPRLLLPALSKVYAAGARFELNVDRLRCAEALRLYAAAHDGKPPARLADVTAVPLPLDPFTGKAFDSYYRLEDGRGVLDVPPPPGMPPAVGRRFELSPR